MDIKMERKFEMKMEMENEMEVWSAGKIKEGGTDLLGKEHGEERQSGKEKRD
jgi:hypothetical protein